MKGKKDPKKSKQGRPLKELLPPGFNKAAREPQPIVVNDLTPSTPSFDIVPPSLCPQWPGDDVALSHDFGLNSQVLFEDDWEYCFPPSFNTYCNNGRFHWRWPDDLLPSGDASRSSIRRVSMKKTVVHTTTSKDQSRTNIEDLGDDPGWSIVTFIERDETQEELEIRRQKEMEKFIASKKKGKPEEVHIGKVKEVKLANMDLNKNLPLICRWLCSQLQVIKDKNWNFNNESVWNKIYPQKDGIPIFNPSGKYWVKLNLLGSPKLVEIDAKIPTHEGSLLFPKTTNFRDLWPVLICKAYFKLYSYRWKNISKFISSPNQELDGSLIYSISGLVPQHKTFDNIGLAEWEELKGLLSDESWEQNFHLISVYCNFEKNPAIPSMSYIEEEDEDKEKDKEKSISAEEANKSAKDSEIHGKKVQFAQKSKPINIVQGFSYLLTDIFANTEDFDMRKVQKKEKARQEEDVKNALIKAKASSPARKLRRHQSPARIRELQKKKAKRGKEKEERRQKLLEPRSYPIYKLIRIKTGVSGVPNLNVEAPFLPVEIDEARLRMMNKDHFLNRDLEELERLMDAEDIELFDPKESAEIDIGKVIKEDKLEGLAMPKQRCQGGIWFAAEDFPNALHEYFIYHEITHFPYKLHLDDTWKDRNQPYIHNQNFDVWIVDANPQEIVNLVIAFSPLLPEGSLFAPDSVYLHLQKYDFEKESVIEWAQEVKLVTTSIVSKSYAIEGEYLVLRPLIQNCPCGFMTWISSSQPIYTMSRLQYLVEKVGWNQNRLNFEYSFVNKGFLYIPFKIEITSEETQGTMIKVSCTDPNMLQFAKLILIDRDQSTNELNYIYLDLNVLETQRLTFPPNQKGYRLLLVVFTSGNLPEGTVTVDIVAKSGEVLKAIAGDMMDPVEYSDRYVPNKYGIIFKEQLFVPEEVHFSLHIRMRKGGLPVPGGKGKDIVPEEHLTTTHLLLIEIYDGEELIAATKGYNQAIIPHLNLKTNSKELIMVCKYDIDEWPDCKNPSSELQDLNWVLRVIASDTIALIKDTRKEDKEEAIRKSWEVAQPGRAEQAKQSRLRFLAYSKSARGEDLTDHEKELLKETWQDRRKAKKETEAAGKGKTKAKEDKKQKEVEKPVAVEVEIPNPDDHVMIPIKKFLSHIHSDRLITLNSQEPMLFAMQYIEQTRQKIKSEMQGYIDTYAQKKNMRVQEKSKLDVMKESFKEIMNSRKEALDQNALLYKEARAGYQNKIELKKK